jgi:hypothetical protein
MDIFFGSIEGQETAIGNIWQHYVVQRSHLQQFVG